MASFVYFYSKFTDEFLLLTASAMFFLLASYCYHWAVNRRRLGSSPQMVPASIVKEYLNQLINEAQFIRTQLFGILSSANENSDPEHVDALFNSLLSSRGNNASSAANYAGAADANHDGAGVSGSVPNELIDRIKSLELQLAEKEGMVVNVNVEKTKLLKDLESFKSSGKAPAAGSEKNNDDLLKRLKMLEQQLEEYNMFEDDLANIKRIQQENEQLKRKIEEVSAYNGAAITKAPVAPAPVAALPEVKGEVASKAPSLDQASINALLEGESPVPPAVEVAPPTAADMNSEATEDLDALAKSVESSLEAAVSAAAVVEAVAEPIATVEPVVAAAEPVAAPKLAAVETQSASAKSDEELLKEFENLLNSG